MITFKEKIVFIFISLVLKKFVNSSVTNFKRVASCHQKLYNEQGKIFYSYVTFSYAFLITYL